MDAPIVIFRLAGQRLALPAASVRECLPLPVLQRRPGSPATVAGFFSLGGRMLPVIDLAVLLGLRAEPFPAGPDPLYRPLLLLDMAALLVDALEQVAVPDAAWADGAPDRWQHDCVTAHLQAAGAPAALLQPDRLLLLDERERLDALTRDAERRARSWAAEDAMTGDAVTEDAVTDAGG